MTSKQLRGQYRNNVGYNGQFILTEAISRSQKNRKSSRKSDLAAHPSAIAISPDLNVTNWDPMVKDGERMLFVGNSFMANEGGVQNYLAKALRKKQIEITTDDSIHYGKPLRAMLQPAVASKIAASNVDSVVITSGDPLSMKHFADRTKREEKKLFVFMSWSPTHPGNRATEKQYTDATRSTVREMRAFERQTGAVIIPTAVVFHDLTVRPPEGVPRVDYLWRVANIHQNELGTMVNAWMHYAILTGQSPVGVNFDMPPYVVGQRLQKTPELRLTRELRLELQHRVWSVAQAWRSGKCHLE